MSAPLASATLVVGACGGCGTSTVAAGLALLAARAGAGATLVELDLAAPDVRGAWGLAAPRTLAELVPVADELGVTHVERAAAPHPSGVAVLVAPAPGPARAEVGRVAARVVRVAGRRGPVLVDGGRGLAAATESVVEVASRVLIVTSATIAGSRRARLLHERIGDLGAANRCRLVLCPGAGRRELRAGQVARLTGLDVATTLPRATGEALALGAGLWPRAGRRRLRDALARLAAADT